MELIKLLIHYPTLISAGCAGQRPFFHQLEELATTDQQTSGLARAW